jgi:sensor histidine kinase YesM
LFVDTVGQPVSWASRILYHAWMMIFFGGLAAAVEASQRRHARMLAALRAAELRRASAQQRLAQMSLGALQARIDPAFVFETLSRLERLYETDPAGADRLLDELIAFLRQALAEIHSAPLRAA